MKSAAEMIFNFSLLITDSLRAPHTKYGVGQYVLSMSPERREILKTLKSKDLRKIRDDLIRIMI